MLLDLSIIENALARPPSRVPDEVEGVRGASVAAVLTPQLEFLFMRRARVVGDPWSGHLSFPGGKTEPDDATALSTAIRETHEELGFDLSHHSYLGELDEMPTVKGLPPMVIKPFLFVLDHEPRIAPNHEVASVHTLGLDQLLQGVGRTHFELTYNRTTRTLPAVDFDGVRLWGLTLHVVDDLLDRIDGRGKGLARPLR